MIQVQAFTVNPFMEQSYLVYDDSDRSACIIDPGFSNSAELQLLTSYVQEHQLHLLRCLCTHRHLDHIMGTGYVYDHYGIAPEYDSTELIDMPDLSHQCQTFGLPIPTDTYESPGTTIQYHEPGIVECGAMRLRVLSTPGHSPGHVAFAFEMGTQSAVCSGDLIFAGGMGRTDLWGGDYAALMHSIRVTLPDALPPDTIIYPGHGPATTLARELANY